MTREQRDRALKILESAIEIGAGLYWKYSPLEEAIFSDPIGPNCSVGHLAWESGLRSPPLETTPIQQAYGLTTFQIFQIERINDDSSDEDRKQNVINYLLSLEVEDEG